MSIAISIDEIDLLLDALTRASRRHDKMAGSLKPGSKLADKHDRMAKGMRSLCAKLLGIKSGTAPVAMEIAE